MFVLYANLALCQSWSWVDTETSHTKSTLLGSAVFNDSLLIVGGKLSVPSCFYQGIVTLQNGVEKWHLTSRDTSNAFFRTIFTTPSIIHTVGVEYNSGDVVMDERVVFAAYSPNGKQLYTLETTEPLYLKPPWE